eukprot:11172915-Alexandrium_andersonii.AAC.1
MVLEAHGGGWSAAARHVLDWVARHAALARQEEPAVAALRLAQRMSATLQRGMRAQSSSGRP